MKANLIKGALAALIAASAAYFRALLGPVLVLALVMASDYVTGVLAAYRTGALSSRTGLLGILKKLGYLFCVGVAVTVDFTVRSAGARLGYDLGGFCAFALLVTVWLILNECLSILENLTEIGVPVPGFLRAVVERLKGSAEETGEEKAPLCERGVARSAGGTRIQSIGDTNKERTPTAARRVPSRDDVPPADLNPNPSVSAEGADSSLSQREPLPQAAAARNSLSQREPPGKEAP
jgi:toxin secretion/phage lysis holin